MVEHVPRRFAERRSHERDGLFDVLFDKLRPQAQHPIAQTTELSIAPLIRTRTLRVIPAIHFDDEPSRRCEEIDNHPADDHERRESLLALRGCAGEAWAAGSCWL